MLPFVADLSPQERERVVTRNVLLFPAASEQVSPRGGTVYCQERLGGLLKYYHREAA